MMALLFLLLTIDILLACLGYRKAAITLLLLTLVVCGIWFSHHATDTLSIHL